MMEAGSVSGRTKNTWILRIWIRNTVFHILKLTIFLTIVKINFSAYPLLATLVVLRMMVPPRMVRGAALGAGQTVGQLPAHSSKRIKAGLRIRITIVRIQIQLSA